MFTKMNSYLRNVVRTWSPSDNRAMGEASDFLQNGMRFNFRQELKKARRTLEQKIAEYAAQHGDLKYRDICRVFGLSLGSLHKIMRRYRKRRNAPADTFLVRHDDEGQTVDTVVTVTGWASVRHKRLRLAKRYKTQDIVEGDDPSILRREEHTAQSLGLRRR